MKSNDIVSKIQCCEALGCTRPTLDKWIKAGLPVIAPPDGNRRMGYKISVSAARRWLKKRNAAIKASQPTLEQRIFEAVRKEWWSLCRPLMRPDDLRLCRDRCRTTDDLIRSGYRMGKSIGYRLEQLSIGMFVEEYPDDIL